MEPPLQSLQVTNSVYCVMNSIYIVSRTVFILCHELFLYCVTNSILMFERDDGVDVATGTGAVDVCVCGARMLRVVVELRHQEEETRHTHVRE